jgi:hypothetical protein
MTGVRILALAALLHAGASAAETTAAVGDADHRADSVKICYNYGCGSSARVDFTPAQLDSIARLLAASDAAGERKALGRAIGRMYYFAGETTPIWHDRGLNFRDDGVRGRMDCIDHSSNTSEFLGLLERRGLMRYHKVLTRLHRERFVFAEHWTARIAEIDNGAEYAVDSWYFDPGEPAAVMPIRDWLSSKDPRG